MRIDQVMTTDVATCSPDDTLHRAAQLMWERDCGSIPVLKDGKPVGIITDRDLAMAAYTQGRAFFDIKVNDVMTRDLAFCAPGDSIESAMRLMQQRQVRRLPVVSLEGKLSGIISLNDLAVRAPSRLSRPEKDVELRQVEETLSAVSQPRRSGARA